MQVPHEIYSRDGDNLHVTGGCRVTVRALYMDRPERVHSRCIAARISLLEALTGCSLHLKFLDGQPLHVQVTINSLAARCWLTQLHAPIY